MEITNRFSLVRFLRDTPSLLIMERPGPSTLFHHAKEALRYLHQRVPDNLIRPKVGIICGSGLGGLAAMVEPTRQCEVDYADIPHFTPSTGMATNSMSRGDQGQILVDMTKFKAMPAGLYSGI